MMSSAEEVPPHKKLTTLIQFFVSSQMYCCAQTVITSLKMIDQMMNKYATRYQSFCALTALAFEMPSVPKLSPLEVSVLNKLIVLWSIGEPVPVVGFMKTCGDISPQSVHRLIKRLKRMGMISLLEHETDGRRKSIVPTKLCHTFVAIMDSVVLSSCNRP